jgi:hypothetical protein
MRPATRVPLSFKVTLNVVQANAVSLADLLSLQVSATP